MKRHWVLALAALAVLPRLASAQMDNGWGPRFHVAPFIGLSPGFSQTGVATIVSANGFDQSRYRLDYSGSMPVGINAEYRFFNRFGVGVGAAYSLRGQGKLLDIDGDHIYAVKGDKLWLMHADAAVHLRELNSDMQLRRVNATLLAGPLFIKDQARQDIFTPNEATNTVDQWGLHLAVEAELPTSNPNLSFIAGVEDGMIFWNNIKYGRRVEGYLATDYPNTATIIAANRSNLIFFRAGLAYKF